MLQLLRDLQPSLWELVLCALPSPWTFTDLRAGWAQPCQFVSVSVFPSTEWVGEQLNKCTV